MFRFRLLIVAVLFTALSYGQLSDTALLFKENIPTEYALIRGNAVEKWEDNHSMVVYEINKQSEALLDFLKLTRDLPEGDRRRRALGKAMLKWKDGEGYNWSMVLYEYKKQLENMDY